MRLIITWFYDTVLELCYKHRKIIRNTRIELQIPLQIYGYSKLTSIAQSNASWWKPLLASDLHRDNLGEGLPALTLAMSTWSHNMCTLHLIGYLLMTMHCSSPVALLLHSPVSFLSLCISLASTISHSMYVLPWVVIEYVLYVCVVVCVCVCVCVSVCACVWN